MPATARELIAAAKKGDRTAAGRLIRNGLDPNSRDAEGFTVLIWAARMGHRNLVAALLKWGANPNARDQKGQTALHHAVTAGHRGVVRTLASAGADLNAKDADDCTPFDLASLAGDYKTAKELAKLGAKGSPPDPGVLSIGQERVGSDYLPIHEAIDLLVLRLSELPEHNFWGERGHLRVIFQTPVSRDKSGREGTRKTTFSKKKNLLVVEVAIPKSLMKKRPVEFLLNSIHKAIDLAEPIFKRAKIEFAAAAIRDYLLAIGAMKYWEFPDFRS
jgi:hypothetical protein